MNFEEYQEGTSKTNIYSGAIRDLLYPIWFALYSSTPEHEQDTRDALVRLDEIEELLNLCYVVLGYTGEVAELANKTKKILRSDKTIDQFKAEAVGEIGDGYWYGIGQLPTLLGLNAAEIAQNNLENYKVAKNEMYFGAMVMNGKHGCAVLAIFLLLVFLAVLLAGIDTVTEKYCQIIPSLIKC